MPKFVEQKFINCLLSQHIKDMSLVLAVVFGIAVQLSTPVPPESFSLGTEMVWKQVSEAMNNSGW